MKKSGSQKVLTFSSQAAITIHPDLWDDTIRPADSRDLRFDKIASLQAAMAAGTYTVSFAELAEKLIVHLTKSA